MLADTRNSKYTTLCAPAWNAVRFAGGLWKERTDTVNKSTVPYIREVFENDELSHAVANFRNAAGQAGPHKGAPFTDGDFYKWLEAAIYAAAQTDDGALLRDIDGYIAMIARAQTQDGYISTQQIIAERDGGTDGRNGNVNNFEVYNFGHLFTAAALHHRVTGKENFIDIAVKAAGYLERLYRDAAKRGGVKTAVCPSHYMGIVELYRETGFGWLLDLAVLSLKLRDEVKDGTDDNQDRLPLPEHQVLVGHAVRANYLYAGAADVYLETGDEGIRETLDRVWNDLVSTKLYITGGCGALYNGVSPYGNFWTDQKVHQAYGHAYQLPNATAYNETCASIGLVLWAYRMFLIKPDAEYFDVIERAMLNVNLAGISLEGNRFFYQNMLAREPNLPVKLCWPQTRFDYVKSFCCPPNAARHIAQASEYLYVLDKDSVYTGLYGQSRADIRLANGACFAMDQDTDYPFDGRIRFKIRNYTGSACALMLRVPSWAQNASISFGGSCVKAAPGYARVAVSGDCDVTLCLDMPARLTCANAMVEANINQAAVEKGPVVYCVEQCDCEYDLSRVMIGAQEVFDDDSVELCHRSIPCLKTSAYILPPHSGALYQPVRAAQALRAQIRLIPYYAWDNRDFGKMKLWLPLRY